MIHSLLPESLVAVGSNPDAVIDVESRLDAALSYARGGFAVLPLHSALGDSCSCGRVSCSSVGKHPRTPRGVKDATTNQAKITGWYEKWPDANLGIATGQISGVVVLDIDVGIGKDGPLSLEHLKAEYGELPETVRSETGGGGFHLFFRWTGQNIGSRTSLRPGIDFRGDGGYVVVPPSVHVSGQSYVWEASSSLDRSKLADVPKWLLNIVRGPSQNGSRPTTRSDLPERGAIPNGTRNTTLASMGGAMRAVGFEYPAIRKALLGHNAAHCDSPLDDREVAKIATSVARYPPKVPRAGGLFLSRDLLLDKRLRSRPNERRLFLHLLAIVTWREQDVGTGQLGVGEVRRSYRDLIKELTWDHRNKEEKWSTSNVKTYLEYLKILGLIEVLGTELGTLIKVVNYEQYRGVPTGKIPSFEQGSEQL